MEIVLGVVGVVVLAAVIGLLVFQIRRRARSGEVLPPPELSQPVDYTSLPYEEPKTFADRLRDAPLGTKILMGILPLLFIVGAVVAYLVFSLFARTPEPTPAGPPPEFMDGTARITSAENLVVQADTNLPDGAPVTAELLEDGQPFVWFDPNSASETVRNGRVRISLRRSANNAQTPNRNSSYEVVLSSVLPDGTSISSVPLAVEVPDPLAGRFYNDVASAPTATSTPRPSPTQAATVQATAVPTPTVQATPTLTATVFNGGNVRAAPNLGGQVLDQINAGEEVRLLEKTADNAWYRILNIRNIDGWVSGTLLTIRRDVADRVPLPGQAAATPASTPAGTPSGLTATVFNGGNVRAAPNLGGQVLDQINANETVQLVARTADGAWYRIINIRSIDGWVNVTLLRLPADAATQVPVQ